MYLPSWMNLVGGFLRWWQQWLPAVQTVIYFIFVPSNNAVKKTKQQQTHTVHWSFYVSTKSPPQCSVTYILAAFKMNSVSRSHEKSVFFFSFSSFPFGLKRQNTWKQPQRNECTSRNLIVIWLPFLGKLVKASVSVSLLACTNSCPHSSVVSSPHRCVLSWIFRSFICKG